MESLIDHGYSGMNNGTRVHHIFQGIKSTELEAAVNVVWAQQSKYGKDFNATVSYLGHLVMKKGYCIKSVHIAKILSQPTKPKMVPFMGKIQCKK